MAPSHKKIAKPRAKCSKKTLNNLHNPTLGQAYRKAARRWLQTQQETKAIPGRIAEELILFVRKRPIGGRKKGGVEREDLSVEAEATWARYLGELAETAGDKEAVGRNQAAIRAYVAAKGAGGEDRGTVGGGKHDADAGSGSGDGDGVGVKLSQEPQFVDEGVDVSKTI